MTFLEITGIWQRIHGLTLICLLSLFCFITGFFSQLPQRALLRRYDSWFMDPLNDYFLVQTTQLVINSMYSFECWLLHTSNFGSLFENGSLYLAPWKSFREILQRLQCSGPRYVSKWSSMWIPALFHAWNRIDAITDGPHRRNFKIFNPFLFKARRKDTTSLKS